MKIKVLAKSTQFWFCRWPMHRTL